MLMIAALSARDPQASAVLKPKARLCPSRCSQLFGQFVYGFFRLGQDRAELFTFQA